MDSSVWLILLVVGIIAMIFGPIMMLQPNSRQRRQEKLRSHALTIGFRVAMRPLPKALKDREAGTLVPVYTFLLPRDADRFGGWFLQRSDYAHESHLLDYWEWQDKIKSGAEDLQWLDRMLPQVPASVLAIAASAQGIHWYWTESGGEETLEKLKALSQDLPR
jgi:hypothetical protein